MAKKRKRKQLTTEEKKELLREAGEKALADGLELRRCCVGSRKEGFCCLIGALSPDRGQNDSAYAIADEVLNIRFRLGVVDAFDGHPHRSSSFYKNDPEAREMYQEGYEAGEELSDHFGDKVSMHPKPGFLAP